MTTNTNNPDHNEIYARFVAWYDPKARPPSLSRDALLQTRTEAYDWMVLLRTHRAVPGFNPSFSTAYAAALEEFTWVQRLLNTPGFPDDSEADLGKELTEEEIEALPPGARGREYSRKTLLSLRRTVVDKHLSPTAAVRHWELCQTLLEELNALSFPEQPVFLGETQKIADALLSRF